MNFNPQSKGQENLNFKKAVDRDLIYFQVNLNVSERFPAQLKLETLISKNDDDVELQ